MARPFVPTRNSNSVCRRPTIFTLLPPFRSMPLMLGTKRRVALRIALVLVVIVMVIVPFKELVRADNQGSSAVKNLSNKEDIQISNTTPNKLVFTSQGGNSVSGYLYNTLMDDQQDKQGTFVEFGCADGTTNSNTFPFEKQLGWKGLCIEPNYINYLKAAAVRENAIFALVTGEPGNFTYAQMHGRCDQHSGIVEFYSPQYKSIMDQCEQEGLLERMPLEGIPLDILLAKNDFTYVDWISVDCEGCEASFITNFNFTKWGVQVVNYEPNTAAQMHTTEINAAFTQHGFELDRVLQDVIWRKPGPFNLGPPQANLK